MDWQQLKSFYTITQLGSVTRAADALFRTQSALSQQIAKLEGDLGCTLFDRIGKNLELTEEGRELFVFAEDVFLRERALTDRLSALSGKVTGSIYITAPFAVNCLILSRLFPEFQEKYPDAALHIYDVIPQICTDLILQGKADFGFVQGSIVPNSLNKIPWMRGQYMAVVKKGHELEGQGEIFLEELIKYPLNVPKSHVKASARDNLDRLCEKAGLSYKTCVVSPNVAVTINYAIQGIGVAVLLCYPPMIEEYKDRASFLSLSHLFPDDWLSVVTRNNAELTDIKKECLDFFMDKGKGFSS